MNESNLHNYQRYTVDFKSSRLGLLSGYGMWQDGFYIDGHKPADV